MSTRSGRRTWRSVGLALLLAVVVPATGLPGLPAVAGPREDRTPYQARREQPVPVRTLSGAPPGPTEVSKFATTAPAQVRWPAPGVAEVEPAKQAKADRLPVGVAPRAGSPAKVRVEILDRKDRDLTLRVDRADGLKAAATVPLELDYSGFRDAYGADWSARLRFVALPDCALSTPDLPECAGTPVPTRNDTRAGRLSADVPTGGLVAAMAGTSSPSGSFGATSLNQSSTWTGGGSGGDFSWSYPLTLPAVAGPLVPQVGFSYSSQSVDGRTATTNNQPSAIGEGFDFQPGHLERKYKPCADDQKDGNNAGRKTHDLCWATDNATLALSGRGGELVQVDAAGETWRLRNDDGTRVQRLGKSTGAYQSEHWVVTSPEGTKYYFGSRPAAKSTFTVPVFGNHSNEPCYAAAFGDSSCTQAYRWNLDYVVDPHGNAMAYYYDPETNYYARNQNTASSTGYVRGGQLNRIEYGLRDGVAGKAPAQLVFQTADRCLPGTPCTFGSPGSWTDTPVDLNCGQGACKVQSPSFWTQKRLARVAAQVWNGTRYEDVDAWSLRQSFPRNEDTTRPGLFLDGITHTGYVGGELSEREVVFDGERMPNRANESDGALMNWWRIRSIRNENGGTLTVTYSDKDCRSLPAAPETNTQRCQPSLREEDGQQKLEYFNKYVVTKVVQSGAVTGDPSMAVETEYEYRDGAAWAFDEADGLVPLERKTWSVWRGYEKVRTRTGNTTEGPQTYSQTQYFRGMNDDRLPNNQRRKVSITDSEGGTQVDHPRLAGSVRETLSYDGVKTTPVVVAATVNDPWISAATARVERPWGVLEANHTGTAKVRSRTLLADGRWRRTQTETKYGDYGVATQVNDLGDLATADDDKCTRYTHTRNLDKWLLALPSRSETVAVSCDKTPNRPADVLADHRITYAGGNAPLHSEPLRTEEMSGWKNGAPELVTTAQSRFDEYGRPTGSAKADEKWTTTEYLASAAGRPTAVKVTNPLGHVETTELDKRGAVVAQVDANGKRSELESDPLGRTKKVWAPGRKRGEQTPNAEFDYLIRSGQPNAITTRRLQHDGSYQPTIELYDGLNRLRQTQTTSPSGGRTIADIVYGSRGQVVKRNSAFWNSDAPSTNLAVADDAQVPAQTVTTYDGSGFAYLETFYQLGKVQWETRTTDGGDRISVDPPRGATPTMQVKDAKGNTVELHQFLGDSPTGAADVTRYGYDKLGRLASVTDPAGNVWRYHRNLRGEVTSTEDPDRGTTTNTYTKAGAVETTTDAKNNKLFFSYDDLGRKTAVRNGGDASGKLRQSWVYDTLAKGHPTSATRHVDDAKYTSEITGYDDGYRPTGATVKIPSTEGKLAGNYAVSSTYTANGLLASTTLPAVAGLPAEKLEYGFDAFSQQKTLAAKKADGSIAFSYVYNTKYTDYGEVDQLSLGQLGKAVWVSHEYEAGTRRLKRLVTDRDSAGMRQGDLTFQHDAAGNVTGMFDQPSEFTGVPADLQCFRNDYLGRLDRAWTPATPDCAKAPVKPNPSEPTKYWTEFGYDKTGNRTSERQFTTAGETTRTHTYPAAAAPQPHTLTAVTTKKPDGTTAKDEYGYDELGNTKTRKVAGKSQALTWDVEGKLESVTEGTARTDYVYDADGTRLLRKDPAGTTLYVNGMEIKLDKAGAVSGTRYYSHAGQPVALRSSSGSVTWLSSDHHDSVTLAINAETLEVSRRRFTPFGGERGATAAWPDDHGFIGAVQDRSTGLTHVGAREYDSATGRFISLDPVTDHGDPQQLNGYAYSNNNPATDSDASGLRATCESGSGPGDGGVSDKGCGVPIVDQETKAAQVNYNRAVQQHQADVEKAKAVSKKDVVIETLKEVGLALLLDLIGFTSIRDCFTKGSVGACVDMITDFVPVGKLGKLVFKLGKALFQAFKVFRRISEEIRHATKALGELASRFEPLPAAAGMANAVVGGGGGGRGLDTGGGGASAGMQKVNSLGGQAAGGGGHPRKPDNFRGRHENPEPGLLRRAVGEVINDFVTAYDDADVPSRAIPSPVWSKVARATYATVKTALNVVGRSPKGTRRAPVDVTPKKWGPFIW